MDILQVTKQMMVGWEGKNSLEKKKKFIWTLVPKLEGQSVKTHRAQYSIYIYIISKAVFN